MGLHSIALNNPLISLSFTSTVNRDTAPTHNFLTSSPSSSIVSSSLFKLSNSHLILHQGFFCTWDTHYHKLFCILRLQHLLTITFSTKWWDVVGWGCRVPRWAPSGAASQQVGHAQSLLPKEPKISWSRHLPKQACFWRNLLVTIFIMKAQK